MAACHGILFKSQKDAVGSYEGGVYGNLRAFQDGVDAVAALKSLGRGIFQRELMVAAIILASAVDEVVRDATQHGGCFEKKVTCGAVASARRSVARAGGVLARDRGLCVICRTERATAFVANRISVAVRAIRYEFFANIADVIGVARAISALAELAAAMVATVVGVSIDVRKRFYDYGMLDAIFSLGVGKNISTARAGIVRLCSVFGAARPYLGDLLQLMDMIARGKNEAYEGDNCADDEKADQTDQHEKSDLFGFHPVPFLLRVFL